MFYVFESAAESYAVCLTNGNTHAINFNQITCKRCYFMIKSKGG